MWNPKTRLVPFDSNNPHSVESHVWSPFKSRDRRESSQYIQSTTRGSQTHVPPPDRRECGTIESSRSFNLSHPTAGQRFESRIEKKDKRVKKTTTQKQKHIYKQTCFTSTFVNLGEQKNSAGQRGRVAK